MGKIFYLMGKSASGKDSIYKEIKKRFPQLKTVTLYTTRPKREGETEGVEYHFTDEKGWEALNAEGKVIETREYHTVCGLWRYFTVDDGQFRLEEQSCLMIGTLVSYQKLKTYFGDEAVEPLYIEVEDGERLARAVARERAETEPKYAELCRRFLADAEDFSEEKIRAAGIRTRYDNREIDACVRDISQKIEKSLFDEGNFML